MRKPTCLRRLCIVLQVSSFLRCCFSYLCYAHRSNLFSNSFFSRRETSTTPNLPTQDGGGAASDRHKYDDEAGDSDDGPGPEDSDFEDEEVDEDGAFDSADEAR